MKKLLVIYILLLLSIASSAQYRSNLSANAWVDSVFNTLTREQKIAQLMILRAHSNLSTKHVAEVAGLIKKYNIGGLCFFQGGPVRQARLTNFYQSIAKTPLLISIDAEWGVAMRLDSVAALPRQMMLGASEEPQIIYDYGKLVGEQCKRLGIHVNYAPVVDVNNNPRNPVINDRSFGEDKNKVAEYGVLYMKGLQDAGVMACAKHFPGHGDVEVDSHLDLPVINKTRQQLDSLELHPFRHLIDSGVGSIMVAHLYIPAIDRKENLATSLSKKNVTGLLKNEMGYNGIVLTDALDMKGITKFFPEGEASVQALIAGNDMLCLPGDVPGSIAKTLKAIKKGKLSWTDLNGRVKKVLLAKYHAGLHQARLVDTTNLVADLNAGTNTLRQRIAEHAITALKQQDAGIFPLAGKRIAYLGVGIEKKNELARQLALEYNASFYPYTYTRDGAGINMLVKLLREKYDVVIIGMHNYSRRPANNYGLSSAAVQLVNRIQQEMPTVTMAFGNPYGIDRIAATATNLLACYEDDHLTQQAAFRMLKGELIPKGKLPVTVNDELKYGTGTSAHFFFPVAASTELDLDETLLSSIDLVVDKAISSRATPGAVVLVARHGKVAFQKAYGYTTFDSARPVTVNKVYDLASITKTAATTLAIMKLYDQGELLLNNTLGDFLPWLAGSGKESLTIHNVLLHQAGLASWIPFFRETLDNSGAPRPDIYCHEPTAEFNVRIAENLYMRADWIDTIYSRILSSYVGPADYVYSDLDFILLGNVVQRITKQPLDKYVYDMFYRPLGLYNITYQPRGRIRSQNIVPTEFEEHFRQQLLHGDVHDPAAAMLGGVAGHAGLFGNAYELAVLYQMLLNKGEINNIRFFKPETVDLFTGYNSDISRRGLGFDKTEKDNTTRRTPYPAALASPATFGHTGFTGTSVWADPEKQLVYVFLANRVLAGSNDNLLHKMNVRGEIFDIIYQSILPPAAVKATDKRSSEN